MCRARAVVWYEARVLCLGLDGAGKTSVLQRAADRTASAPVAPTTGFIVKTLTLPPDWKVDVWDIGGAPSPSTSPISLATTRTSPAPSPSHAWGVGAAAARCDNVCIARPAAGLVHTLVGPGPRGLACPRRAARGYASE